MSTQQSFYNKRLLVLYCTLLVCGFFTNFLMSLAFNKLGLNLDLLTNFSIYAICGFFGVWIGLYFNLDKLRKRVKVALLLCFAVFFFSFTNFSSFAGYDYINLVVILLTAGSFAKFISIIYLAKLGYSRNKNKKSSPRDTKTYIINLLPTALIFAFFNIALLRLGDFYNTIIIDAILITFTILLSFKLPEKLFIYGTILVAFIVGLSISKMSFYQLINCTSIPKVIHALTVNSASMTYLLRNNLVFLPQEIGTILTILYTIGCLLLMALFLLYVYKAYLRNRKLDNLFHSYLLVGFMLLIIYQVFLALLSILHLYILVPAGLPFIEFSSSNLFFLSVMFGIVERIEAQRLDLVKSKNRNL